MQQTHARYSTAKLADARQALAMVYSLADDFAAEVKQLCATDVSQGEWQAFLDGLVPVIDPKTGERLTGRALTIAEKKREALARLYRQDERVAPWAGTAMGVLKAVNTWEHHESTVRGATRAERNMLRTVTGDFSALDHATWTSLQRVLA